MDIPTIESAFDEAQAELTSTDESKEESKEVETPSQEVNDSKSESNQEEEKSESPEPEKPEKNTKDDSNEEADFLKVDGDTTKMTHDELMEVKKNWEVAYTKKRQAERQELEDLRRQLADKEEVKGTLSEPETKPLDQMSPQEYAQYVSDLAKTEVRVAEDNAYIESQEKSFYEVDSRLNQDNPEFNQDLHDLVVIRLANERESHESEGKPIRDFDFVGRTKELIESYDKNIKSIKQNYLKKQSEIARTKTEDFAKDTPRTSGAKSKKKTMDLDEAMEAAFE